MRQHSRTDGPHRAPRRDKCHQWRCQNRVTLLRLILNPCPAALVQVNPDVCETHTIAPIRRVAPYASLGPVLSAVSPAQRNVPAPRG